MSRMDRDLEQFADMLIQAADYIKYGINVSSYDNCNNCGTVKTCEYAPKLGQMVRINCPLWKAKQTDPWK